MFNQGKHYGIPGILADGQNVQDTMRIGRAAIQHVRNKGPAILQVHTFRFNGHSPADPEHERNRKDEKRWARATCDPIKIFEESDDAKKVDQKAALARARDEVAKALAFANASPPPPKDLAAKLEYPDPTGEVDYSAREPEMGLELAAAVTKATVPEATLTALAARIDALRAMRGATRASPSETPSTSRFSRRWSETRRASRTRRICRRGARTTSRPTRSKRSGRCERRTRSSTRGTSSERRVLYTGSHYDRVRVVNAVS